MAKRITIDLKDRVEGGESIEFLRAETSATMNTPFVIVWYALDGREQDLGLRLDLDKRVFLDQGVFDDTPRRETFVEHAAPLISGVVGRYLSSIDWPIPPDRG